MASYLLKPTNRALREAGKRLGPALLAFALACAPATTPETASFAQLVERLSEPGGYFDTDNLVSNETAYLHVMGGLRNRGVRGGVYIGVGPEQNFSYMAEIAPELAILIDIRRDNLLLHLLFKAMFESADSRIEYLCLLYGRPTPPDPAAWRKQDLAALLAYLDRTPLDSTLHVSNHRMLMERVERYGVELTPEDRATMDRFHDEFVRAGLNLTFTTLGRPPRRDYATVRRLYLETDEKGNQASYLSTEARWRRVQSLERAQRVIPVVGDLAGTHAMQQIAAYLRETGLRVSAFYVSNVEFYLFRAGTFPAFAENTRALPVDDSSVLIRSWFDRGDGGGAGSERHFSKQRLQSFRRFRALAAEPEALNYLMLVADTL